MDTRHPLLHVILSLALVAAVAAGCKDGPPPSAADQASKAPGDAASSPPAPTEAQKAAAQAMKSTAHVGMAPNTAPVEVVFTKRPGSVTMPAGTKLLKTLPSKTANVLSSRVYEVPGVGCEIVLVNELDTAGVACEAYIKDSLDKFEQGKADPQFNLMFKEYASGSCSKDGITCAMTEIGSRTPDEILADGPYRGSIAYTMCKGETAAVVLCSMPTDEDITVEERTMMKSISESFKAE